MGYGRRKGGRIPPFVPLIPSFLPFVSRSRKLHNTLCELKGNIRVYCRVRPITEREQAEGGGSQVVQFPSRAEDSEEARPAFLARLQLQLCVPGSPHVSVLLIELSEGPPHFVPGSPHVFCPPDRVE